MTTKRDLSNSPRGREGPGVVDPQTVPGFCIRGGAFTDPPPLYPLLPRRGDTSNLIAHLLEQAQRRPYAVALVERKGRGSKKTTFAELDARSARAAALLHERGVRKGDRVLLLQKMSAELYVALAAIFRLGAVAVVLDPSAGRAHVAACCRMAGVRAFVGSPKAHLLRGLVPEVARIPLKFVTAGRVPGAVAWAQAGHLAPKAEVAACGPDDPALLTFTSGSTGRPKAAVRSHGLLLAQYRALRRCLDLKPGQVDFATLPIFVLANLAAGVTTVLPDMDFRRPGHVAPGAILRQIREEGATRIAASPAFFERLLTHPDAPATLSIVSHFFTGGAPVFPDLLHALKTAAPYSHVAAVYGSTEAEPMAHLDAADLAPEDVKAMQSGRGLLASTPVEEVVLRVLPDRWGAPLGSFSAESFAQEALPPGEPGEIVVSGAHVVPGYLNGQGDAETKFDVEGTRWHRTGDAGYFDERGRLWLLGRCAAVVKDAHGTVYPFAVESAARALPGVRRAAFAQHRGQRVLVVEAQAGASAGTLRHALAWAKLEAVLFVKKIPLDRRHNAKVDYPALNALLRKKRGR